jgi:hypothetical protein
MSSTDTVNCPICKENIPTDYVVCPYDGYSLIKQLREKVKTKVRLRDGISRSIRLMKSPRSNTNIVLDEVVTNSDRKGPLFILFLFAWVFGFQIAPYYNAYFSSIEPLDIGYVFFFGLIGGFIIAIVTYVFFVIFWFIVSFMIHFSSKMLASSTITGTAAFKETQSIVGYALAPYVVGMFILNTVLFVLLPTNVTGSSFFTTATNFNLNVTYVNGLGPSIVSAVSLIYLIFFIGFSIWSVYICGSGIEKLHRLPRNQAYIIPVAVLALYVFVTYF